MRHESRPESRQNSREQRRHNKNLAMNSLSLGLSSRTPPATLALR